MPSAVACTPACAQLQGNACVCLCQSEHTNSPNIYQTLSRIRSSFELEVQP
jgi:hypothetical protein